MQDMNLRLTGWERRAMGLICGTALLAFAGLLCSLGVVVWVAWAYLTA
jgi:hypothetical protein